MLLINKDKSAPIDVVRCKLTEKRMYRTGSSNSNEGQA